MGAALVANIVLQYETGSVQMETAFACWKQTLQGNENFTFK